MVMRMHKYWCWRYWCWCWCWWYADVDTMLAITPESYTCRSVPLSLGRLFLHSIYQMFKRNFCIWRGCTIYTLFVKMLAFFATASAYMHRTALDAESRAKLSSVANYCPLSFLYCYSFSEKIIKYFLCAAKAITSPYTPLSVNRCTVSQCLTVSSKWFQLLQLLGLWVFLRRKGFKTNREKGFGTKRK